MGSSLNATENDQHEKRIWREKKNIAGIRHWIEARFSWHLTSQLHLKCYWIWSNENLFRSRAFFCQTHCSVHCQYLLLCLDVLISFEFFGICVPFFKIFFKLFFHFFPHIYCQKSNFLFNKLFIFLILYKNCRYFCDH